MIKMIAIHSINENGDITSYTTTNLFRDEAEMIRWFAADYSIAAEHSRYEYHLDNQWLSKDDICLDAAYPRRVALIELGRDCADNDWCKMRILDIRNYERAIARCRMSGNSIAQTRWQNTVLSRKPVMGRTHSKYSGYIRARGSMFKSSLVCRYKGDDWDIYDNEDFDSSIILCPMPDTNVRHSSSRDMWDDGWSTRENNWKQRKVRHQWQWHKPHANGRRHYYVYEVSDEKDVREDNLEDISFLDEEMSA